MSFRAILRHFLQLLAVKQVKTRSKWSFLLRPFLGIFYRQWLKEMPQNGSKSREKVPKCIEKHFSRLLKLRIIDGMMKKIVF